MLAALADHLWQSLLTGALGALLAVTLRGRSAVLRLWLWRLCALKFFVPYAIFDALGAWMGFPVAQAGQPAPAALVSAVRALAPWVAPLQTHAVSSLWLAAVLLGLALAGIACLRGLFGVIAVEFVRARAERERLARDPDDRAPPLGFWRAALLTSSGLSILSAAVVSGAVADRSRRIDLLAEHARALRNAGVTMVVAAPGMGTRARLYTDSGGIFIRNTSVRELIALSNGVSPYSVWTNQMISTETDPDAHSWLDEPRYDVRVLAPIREPGEFDAYALRQRMTRLLVDRFGLEIHVNGKCQPPCGRWDTMRDERPY